MKVSTAIEMLTKFYDKDDELLMCWWDKDTYPEHNLTEEEWREVLAELDDYDGLEEVMFAIDEVVAKIRSGENE